MKTSSNQLTFPMNFPFSSSLLFVLLTLFSSCKQDEATPAPENLTYTFEAGSEGWEGGFADYPNDAGVEEFYEFAFSHSNLPEPLDISRGALMQSGSNRSDDLFMFVKRKLTGLSPSQNYQVSIEVEFATDAASGAMGIGGPPGEAVYLKAGASSQEPVKVLDNADNHFRMNIDKGNQSVDGQDMKNIGDFANGTEKFEYTLKSLRMASPLLVRTNADGELWVIVGTDSGFEGITTIYYNRIQVEIEEVE